MEFTNEIFFNKPLTAEETVIITYCGKLYREHSQEIAIVYGFGDDWQYTEEAQMKEIENGFEVTLHIRDLSTFNFCFRNNYNIWDNNSGFNYISPILPKQISTENIVINSQPSEDSNNVTKYGISDKEDINIQEVSEQPIKNQKRYTSSTKLKDSISKANKNVSSDVANESIKSEAKSNSQDEVEKAFASLLDSVLDISTKSEKIDVNSLEGFGLQSVDEIKEEKIVNCDEIFQEFYDEITENPATEAEKSFNSSFPKENDTIDTVITSEEDDTNYDSFKSEELDALMDNILKSILKDDYKPTDLSTPVEKIEDNQNISEENEVYGLPAIQENSEDWINKCVNAFKKFGTACKKVGSLIKLKAQEYGFIREK